MFQRIFVILALSLSFVACQKKSSDSGQTPTPANVGGTPVINSVDDPTWGQDVSKLTRTNWCNVSQRDFQGNRVLFRLTLQENGRAEYVRYQLNSRNQRVARIDAGVGYWGLQDQEIMWAFNIGEVHMEYQISTDRLTRRSRLTLIDPNANQNPIYDSCR